MPPPPSLLSALAATPAATLVVRFDVVVILSLNHTHPKSAEHAVNRFPLHGNTARPSRNKHSPAIDGAAVGTDVGVSDGCCVGVAAGMLVGVSVGRGVRTCAGTGVGVAVVDTRTGEAEEGIGVGATVGSMSKDGGGDGPSTGTHQLPTEKNIKDITLCRTFPT